MAAAFGALGGVIYELIALQGNIEWPHRTKEAELPEGGYAYAKPDFLFDLGIVARVIVGAGAAIIVFYVLPPEQGIRLVAVSIIAGSAGSAVFRSVQDRLLAAVAGEKLQNLDAGLEELDARLQQLEEAEAFESAADMASNVGEIRGRIRALRRVARPR